MNIDNCNPYKSIGELIRAGNMNYHRITQQRVDGTIPKAEDLLRLSGAMNKSIEFLLTGQERKLYPKRIEKIADCCMYRASEEDILLIERVLRIQSPSTEKKESRATSGSGALA